MKLIGCKYICNHLVLQIISAIFLKIKLKTATENYFLRGDGSSNASSLLM